MSEATGSQHPPPGGRGKGQGSGRGGGAQKKGVNKGQGARKASTTKTASFDVVRATKAGYAHALASNKLALVLSVYQPQPTISAVVNAVGAHLQNGGNPEDIHPTLLRTIKEYVDAKNAYDTTRQQMAGSADSGTVAFDFSSLNIDGGEPSAVDAVEEVPAA